MTRPTTNAGKALAREHPDLEEIVRAIEVEAVRGVEARLRALIEAAEGHGECDCPDYWRPYERHGPDCDVDPYLRDAIAALATPETTPAVSVAPVPEVGSPDGTTAGVLSGAEVAK